MSKLDKRQWSDFIRKECVNDSQLQDRFLALGAGTLFKPNPDSYTSRIKDLIEDYAGRHGYIEYRATFDFNRAVTRILDEADEAMRNRQWDVAVAVLTGITAAGDDILNSGDDSAGELGAIVSDCFEEWHGMRRTMMRCFGWQKRESLTTLNGQDLFQAGVSGNIGLIAYSGGYPFSISGDIRSVPN